MPNLYGKRGDLASIRKGNDEEEYTVTAARERDRLLKGFFRKGLWKVASKPECRRCGRTTDKCLRA